MEPCRIKTEADYEAILLVFWRNNLIGLGGIFIYSPAIRWFCSEADAVKGVFTGARK